MSHERVGAGVVTLRTWPLRPAAACTVVGALACADLALVDEEFAVAPRPALAVGVVLFLALTVVALRPLRVEATSAGLRLDRVVGPRRQVPWDGVGEVLVRHGARARTLSVRVRQRRRGALADVPETRRSGSFDAFVAEVRAAGVRVVEEDRSRRRLAAVAAGAAQALVGLAPALVAVAFLTVLPIPGRYLLEPGIVVPGATHLRVAGQALRSPAGGVHLVAASTRPASLALLLSARGQPATEVGSRADILGSDPPEVAEEVDRQFTSAAAVEAVAAAWRSVGVPVSLWGAGVELVSVPPSLRSQLRPEDVVEALDGHPTPHPRELHRVLEHARSRVVLTIRRGPRRLELTIPRHEFARPDRPALAPAEVRLVGAPQPITIDAQGVEGNSAGLAWALAVVDHLEGLSAEPERVVVTGALSLDGTVHPVGAVPQKAAAATAARAALLLVPAEQAAEARRHVGAAVQVVGVRTLREAVAVLTTPAAPRPAGPAAGLERTKFRAPFRPAGAAARTTNMGRALTEREVRGS
ncbi:MAG: hypothetical protein M3P85_02700 [Actinomycetota bacterium]|nr:hypothetical protein [Actinomycetota bacterium]